MPNYDLGTAEGKIVLDASGIDNAVTDANRSLGRLGKGVNAERIGRDLTTGVSLPLIAAGGYALKTAIDFETAFTGVTKTVDGTEAQLNRVRDGIIDMSLRIPAATTEIAAVAEAAGQLGVEIDSIEEFTEVMIALGVSTNLTADQAANSIARITNIMGTGTEELGQFGAALVGLGNNSATTEADILEMSNRIAGIANLSESSEAEMLSLAAALSAVGVRAESGGTSVTKTIKDFDEWSEAIRSVDGNFDELGGKAKAFFDLLGGQEGFENFDQLTGVQQYEQFIRVLQDAEAQGGNLIGILADLGLQEIRQSDAILRMVGAGDLLSDTLAIGNAEWEANTALTEEAGKRYETTASQLQIVRNKADNAARIFGEALLPILIDLLNGITPILEGMALMAEAFGKLPEPVRTAIVTVLALLAALGPVIFIGAKIVRTVQAFIGVFKLLGIALTLNPLVLIVAAIAALVVGFVLLYKRSEKFREFINNLGRDIEKVWNSVVDFFKGLPDFFKGLWDKIQGYFDTAKEAVVGAWGDVVEFFTGVGQAIADAFITAKDGIVNFVTGAVEEFVDFFTKLPGVVADGTANALSAFVDWLTELPETIAYWLGFAIGRVIRFYIDFYTWIFKLGVDVIKAVVNFMVQLPGIVAGFFADVFNKAAEWGSAFLAKIIEIGTNVVTFLINKLLEFVTWLPGFLLGILVQIITWGGDLVSEAIRIATEFVNGLINTIISLPGKVASVILEIITSFPGWASDFFNGAADMGVKMVDGLISGIGDLVGLVKDMVLGAINGVSDLGQTAYNKMKSVGSSMWNGFKDGLGINSPSYVEEAAFAMRENLSDVINSLGSQVRDMQNLSRRIPTIAQSDQFATMAAIGPSSGASVAGASTGVGVGGGLTVNGPLIGEAVISDEQDATTLARKVTKEQKKISTSRGQRD